MPPALEGKKCNLLSNWILFYFFKSASILLIYLKLIVKQFLIKKIKVRQLINNMK